MSEKVDIKELEKEFIKVVKKDPMGSALFWHICYMGALRFMNEKALEEEFNEYLDDFLDEVYKK